MRRSDTSGSITALEDDWSLRIARIDTVDPSVAPQRVGQALQQMVDLVSGPAESPEGNGEPVVDIFDQPRSEEQ